MMNRNWGKKLSGTTVSLITPFFQICQSLNFLNSSSTFLFICYWPHLCRAGLLKDIHTKCKNALHLQLQFQHRELEISSLLQERIRHHIQHHQPSMISIVLFHLVCLPMLQTIHILLTSIKNCYCVVSSRWIWICSIFDYYECYYYCVHTVTNTCSVSSYFYSNFFMQVQRYS